MYRVMGLTAGQTVDDLNTRELLEDTIFKSVEKEFNQMKRCGSIG